MELELYFAEPLRYVMGRRDRTDKDSPAVRMVGWGIWGAWTWERDGDGPIDCEDKYKITRKVGSPMLRIDIPKGR